MNDFFMANGGIDFDKLDKLPELERNGHRIDIRIVPEKFVFNRKTHPFYIEICNEVLKELKAKGFDYSEDCAETMFTRKATILNVWIPDHTMTYSQEGDGDVEEYENVRMTADYFLMCNSTARLLNPLDERFNPICRYYVKSGVFSETVGNVFTYNGYFSTLANRNKICSLSYTYAGSIPRSVGTDTIQSEIVYLKNEDEFRKSTLNGELLSLGGILYYALETALLGDTSMLADPERVPAEIPERPKKSEEKETSGTTAVILEKNKRYLIDFGANFTKNDLRDAVHKKLHGLNIPWYSDRLMDKESWDYIGRERFFMIDSDDRAGKYYLNITESMVYDASENRIRFTAEEFLRNVEKVEDDNMKAAPKKESELPPKKSESECIYSDKSYCISFEDVYGGSGDNETFRTIMKAVELKCFDFGIPWVDQYELSEKDWHYEGNKKYLYIHHVNKKPILQQKDENLWDDGTHVCMTYREFLKVKGLVIINHVPKLPTSSEPSYASSESSYKGNDAFVERIDRIDTLKLGGIYYSAVGYVRAVKETDWKCGKCVLDGNKCGCADRCIRYHVHFEKATEKEAKEYAKEISA